MREDEERGGGQAAIIVQVRNRYLIQGSDCGVKTIGGPETCY